MNKFIKNWVISCALCISATYSLAADNKPNIDPWTAKRVARRQEILAIQLDPKSRELPEQKRIEVAKQLYIDTTYGNIKKQLAMVALGLSPILIAQCYYSFCKKDPSQILDMIIKAGSKMPFTTGLLGWLYVSFIVTKSSQLIGNTFNRFVRGINLEAHEEAQIRYLANKHFFSPAQHQAVLKVSIVAEQDTSKADACLSFIENLLSLPREFKPVKYNPEKADLIFNAYEDKIKEKLKNFCFDATNLEYKDTCSQTMFLHGNPGTGKSLAGKFIGQVLDLPVASISLAGKTVKDLEGSSIESGAANPGALAQAMIDAHKKHGYNCKNMILVIDDFDRVLNGKDPDSIATLNYMLQLLDPAGKRSFSSPYFESEIYMPANIILTGNSVIKDMALRRRFNNIYFDGFRASVKKEILWKENIPALVEKYKGMKIDDIPECATATINKLIDQDQDKGFRTINILLADYISDVVRKLTMGSNDDEIKALEPEYIERLAELNAELVEMDYLLPVHARKDGKPNPTTLGG